MKKILIASSILMLASFSTNTTLTDAERKLAITELTNSGEHLLNAVKGLSDVQLNFKASPESWSVAEVTEHIAISEENIFAMMEGTLKEAADSNRRSEIKMSDTQILDMIEDRTNKIKTQTAFEPTGKYGSFKKTLDAFRKKRKDHIKFVMKTKEDLRNHYAVLPFGTIDAFQVILFMSAHTERHIKQIGEVMANDSFPKN